MYWKSVGPCRFKINSLLNFGGNFLYFNDKKSSNYTALCEESISQLTKSVAIILFLILLSHFMYGIGPLYVYLFHDIRITPIETELPFLDKVSNLGFTLNLIEQAILTAYELLGTMSVEICQCLINNAITFVPKVLHLDLDEISCDLNINGMNQKIKIRLRNVLIQLQDFDR